MRQAAVDWTIYTDCFAGMMAMTLSFVIPAKAGIQCSLSP